MPRTARIAPGGIVYHVFNHGVGSTRLFRGRKDYEVFQRCLVETCDMFPTRVLGYCLMPNHWHLLLWPKKDDEMGRFMMRLTNTHVRRWVSSHGEVGRGHLYQGRYKSFAIQDDEHLSIVDRYVERNPLRDKLVKRAEQWPWSALGQSALAPELRVPLAAGSIHRDRNWIRSVNAAQAPAEEEAIRRCIRQNRPFGGERWIARTMTRLGWREPNRPGRPRKS